VCNDLTEEQVNRPRKEKRRAEDGPKACHGCSRREERWRHMRMTPLERFAVRKGRATYSSSFPVDESAWKRRFHLFMAWRNSGLEAWFSRGAEDRNPSVRSRRQRRRRGDNGYARLDLPADVRAMVGASRRMSPIFL
jgi:hypothetical protein